MDEKSSKLHFIVAANCQECTQQLTSLVGTWVRNCQELKFGAKDSHSALYSACDDTENKGKGNMQSRPGNRITMEIEEILSEPGIPGRIVSLLLNSILNNNQRKSEEKEHHTLT